MREEYTETTKVKDQKGVLHITITHFREIRNGDPHGGASGIMENGVEKTTQIETHEYKPDKKPNTKKYIKWLEEKLNTTVLLYRP